MTNIEKINEFLDKSGVWFFLTEDGEQPKGRPFGFHLLKDGTLYFGTGTFKKVYAQIQKNPKVEILAVNDSEFLRYDGEVVFEENDDIANVVLANSPAMQKVYNETTGLRLGIFHLVNGNAEICTMKGQVEAFEV